MMGKWGMVGWYCGGNGHVVVGLRVGGLWML